MSYVYFRYKKIEGIQVCNCLAIDGFFPAKSTILFWILILLIMVFFVILILKLPIFLLKVSSVIRSTVVVHDDQSPQILENF